MAEDRSKSITRSWDRNAGKWTRAVRGGRIPSRRAGTDNAIVGAILDRRPMRLLDVGCGEGWLIRRIRQTLDCQAVGIDGSASLIKDARAAHPDGDYRIVPYDALIADPSVLGDPFDVVVFNYAILGDDATALLSAARSLLAPGGVIMIQTLHPHTQDGPYRDGWRVEDYSGFDSPDWQPMPWYFRTLDSWSAAIREAGLTLIDLAEPRVDGDDRPLSLILTCRAVDR